MNCNHKMLRMQNVEDEAEMLVATENTLKTWGYSVCDALTHGVLRTWYAIVDPQYRDFIVASRRLRYIDSQLCNVVRNNSLALAKAYAHLRNVEEETSINMQAFRTKLRFREQQYKATMVQKGCGDIRFSQKDIESWLSADDVELKFRCIQNIGTVDQVKREIAALQTIHTSLHTNITSVRLWETKLRFGEHARVTSVLLSDIGGNVVRDITAKFDASFSKLEATLGRIGESLGRDIELPETEVAQAEPDDMAVFWENVLGGATIVAPPAVAFVHGERVVGTLISS